MLVTCVIRVPNERRKEEIAMNFSTIGRTVGSDPFLGIDYYRCLDNTRIESTFGRVAN